MHISSLKQSKFLKKEDVGAGALGTIRNVRQENVAMEGAEPELKWVIDFDEFEKPMVLNSSNGQSIAEITGSEDSDGWTGKKVVLYNDPNVSFGGKRMGGIRIRAPRGRAAKVNDVGPIAQNVIDSHNAKPNPANVPAEPEEDDVPF